MNWIKFWSRDYSYVYCEECVRSFYYVGKQFGCYDDKDFFMLYENGIVSQCVKENLPKKLREILGKNYSENLNSAKRFIAEFTKKAKECYAFSKKIKSIENMDNKKIISLLKEYDQSMVDYTRYLWVSWNLNESYSEKCCQYFTVKLKKFGITDINEYMGYISSPIKYASVLKLNKCIERMKKQNKKIDYEKLLNKFIWVPFGDLHNKPWALDIFKKYVDDYKQSSKKYFSLAKMVKELKLNKKEAEMIIVNKNLAYLRDYRDEIRRKVLFNIIPLFRDISKRLKIEYDNLMLLTTNEILEQFNKKTNINFEERKKKAVFYMENGKGKVAAGSDADIFLKKIGFSVHEEIINEIKGLTASKGYAKGTAKIISRDADLKKVESGDILIAITTHPEYVTKMQVAKAIVTDEGGLSCHAAIVARELGVPCIVGTKIATKVLKDGDLVEVNADNGIVRKI